MKKLWEQLARFWKKVFHHKKVEDTTEAPFQAEETVPEKVDQDFQPNKEVASDEANVPEQEVTLSGFAEQSKTFCGLYESLYMAKSTGDASQCRDVLMEWRIRLTAMREKAFAETILERINLSEQENTFLGCAGWLLERIFAEGIVRDDRKILEINELDSIRYGTMDGRTLIPGERAAVLLPCWYYKEYLLERGMVS